MDRKARDVFAAAIGWRKSADGEFPFIARWKEEELAIRLNDFPAEPLYTLIVDGKAAADFDDWPAHWRRPSPA